MEYSRDLKESIKRYQAYSLLLFPDSILIKASPNAVKKLSKRFKNIKFSPIIDIDKELEKKDLNIHKIAYHFRSHEVIYSDEEILGSIKRKEIFYTKEEPLYLSKAIKLIRFSVNLGFKYDIDTNSIRKDEKSYYLKKEFIKVIQSENIKEIFKELLELGILELFLPELKEAYGFYQNRYHKYDLFNHLLYTASYIPPEYPNIRIAGLLHDIGKLRTKKPKGDDFSFHGHEVVSKIMAKKILKRIGFRNKDINDILHLIYNHMFFYTEEWTDKAVRRFIKRIGLENIKKFLILRYADRKATGKRSGMPKEINTLLKRIDEILKEEKRFKIKDLEVDGNDVMKILKIPPGPLVGKVLKYLYSLVVSSKIENNREYLLNEIKRIKDEGLSLGDIQ